MLHASTFSQRASVSLAILLLVNPLLRAQPELAPANMSGNKMLESCTAAIRRAEGQRLNATDSVAGLACLAYLEGFLDSHAFEGARGSPHLYCLPDAGFTVGQLARIVVKEFKEIPDKLHERAAYLLGLTLIRLYPCS